MVDLGARVGGLPAGCGGAGRAAAARGARGACLSKVSEKDVNITFLHSTWLFFSLLLVSGEAPPRHSWIRLETLVGMVPGTGPGTDSGPV